MGRESEPLEPGPRGGGRCWGVSREELLRGFGGASCRAPTPHGAALTTAELGTHWHPTASGESLSCRRSWRGSGRAHPEQSSGLYSAGAR